jgi:hypothetical protein
MKAVPDQIARWVPGRYEVLGTDGFGRSDTRERLRRHFEVDAAHVVLATLAALAADGSVEADVVEKAIARYGVDAGALDPRPPEPGPDARTVTVAGPSPGTGLRSSAWPARGQAFFITGDREADALLGKEPLALLIGMLLDQQVSMELAFTGPLKLHQRLGGWTPRHRGDGAEASWPPAPRSPHPPLPRLDGQADPGAVPGAGRALRRRAEAVWEGVGTGQELVAASRRSPASARRSRASSPPSSASASGCDPPVGGGGRAVLGRRAALGGRRHRPRGAGRGQGVEAGQEGGGKAKTD